MQNCFPMVQVRSFEYEADHPFENRPKWSLPLDWVLLLPEPQLGEVLVEDGKPLRIISLWQLEMRSSISRGILLTSWGDESSTVVLSSRFVTRCPMGMVWNSQKMTK